MSRVNNVQENIISGEKKPRRIKSQGNSCPGGKFWRKTYREEKVWGKDGAKPSVGHIWTFTVHKNDGQYDERPFLHVSVHTLGFAKWTRILRFVQKFAKTNSVLRKKFLG